MSQLEPVTLTFNDKSYTVDKQDSIWGLIEVIEDVITFFDLVTSLSAQKYPTARIFRAYAAALKYAGCKTSANEVREVSNYQDMGEMAGALAMILQMAQPGEEVDLGENTASEKEAEDLKKKAADA